MKYILKKIVSFGIALTMLVFSSHVEVSADMATEMADTNETTNNIPRQNPLDAKSKITLPGRQLTEYELDTWIDEYNEMGRATTFELDVIKEINRVREYYGLNPLALDLSLMMSSRLKAQEFGDLQYYAHISPVHGSPMQSARMFGFEGLSVAEAITQSGSNGKPILRTTPERIVAGMLASSRGHREILLNPNIASVGFGAFFCPAQQEQPGGCRICFIL
jgi:uncharacterized protein YkwD